MNTPAQPRPVGGASLSDILTAIQNIVKGLSTITTNYLNVEGQITYPNISAPTIIKAIGGRIDRVSVITAGTGGFIYDATLVTDTTKPIYVIPDAVSVEPYRVNMPTTYGIFVDPGDGVVTVSYA